MKKIISVLIILCFMLGSVCVQAEESASAGTYGNLLNAFGVSSDIAEPVTRAEFVDSVIKLIDMQGLGTGADLPYSDVAADSAYASSIYAANKLGLISSGDMFYPDEPITYAQAYKILVVLLGYDAEAKLYGGFPSGYMIYAGKLELDENISAAEESLTGSDYLILISNLLGTKARRAISLKDSSGEIGVTYVSDKSFSELYRNVVEFEGVIDANEFSYLYNSSESTDKGYISIEGDLYKCSEAYPLGYKAEGYAKDLGGGRYEIIYLDTSSSELLTVTDAMDPVKKGSKLEYFEDGKTRKASIDNDVAVIYNNKAYEGWRDKDFSINDGYLTLIDADGNGKYETVHISERSYLCIGSITEGGIYDKNGALSLGLNDDEIFLSIKENGSEVSVDDLYTGIFMECFVSRDNKVCFAELLDSYVTGTVDGVNSDDDSIIIGDISYKLTDYFKTYYGYDLGAQLDAVLSTTGSLVAVTNADDAFYWGYAIDIKTSENGLSDSVQIKVLTENGEIEIFTFADKVKINNERKSSKDAFDELKNHCNSMVRYLVDGEGKITAVNYDEDGASREVYNAAEDGEGAIKEFKIGREDNTNANPGLHYFTTGAFNPYFHITASSRVFLIYAGEGEEIKSENCSVGSSLDFLPNEQKYTIGGENQNLWVYNVDADGYAKIVLIKTSRGTASDNSYRRIVSEITRAIDPDGEVSWKITICADDYVDGYLKDKDVPAELKKEDGSLDLEVGDMITMIRDSKGFITQGSLAKEFDKGSMTIETAGHGGYETNANRRLYSGKLYSVSSSAFTVMQPVQPETGGDAFYAFKNSDTTCVYVTKDGMVKRVPISSVAVPYLQAGNDCSKVLVYTWKSTVREFVVFE